MTTNLGYCLVTGNPCGTDSQAGCPCTCQSCNDYLAREVKKMRLEQIKSELVVLLREKREILDALETKEERLDRLRYIGDVVALVGKLGEMDNRKLAWVFMHTQAWKNASDKENWILGTIVDRLYSEYANAPDDALIEWYEWGWKLPDGEIRYI